MLKKKKKTLFLPKNYGWLKRNNLKSQFHLLCLKPLYTFGAEEKKVHRFTNNLQGLQKVMVKDFSWNIIPWNALLFEKTLKQLSILDNENYGCHDTAKRTGTRVGFPLFSPDSDDRLSLNFHRFVVLYISCDTRSVGLGQYCLPKVYNGFKLASEYYEYTVLTHIGVWVKTKINIFYPDANLTSIISLRYPLPKHRIRTASSYQATLVVYM